MQSLPKAATATQSFADGREGLPLVCSKCEKTACKSSEALSSSRLSLLSFAVFGLAMIAEHFNELFQLVRWH